LVATTNALSAFVVDRCAGAGKPTIAAEGAAIVATHAMRFSPKLTHYFLELSDEVPSLHSVTTSSSTFRTYGISPDSRSVSRALRLLTNPSFDIPWVSPGIHSGNPDSNSPSCQWVNFMVFMLRSSRALCGRLTLRGQSLVTKLLHFAFQSTRQPQLNLATSISERPVRLTDTSPSQTCQPRMFAPAAG